MHLHILGIAGTFMGGLAQLARAAGHHVTGADVHVYPPMSTQLQEAGIEVIEGYDPEQLKLQPDCVVVGNVMTRGMPIIEALLNSTQRYTSGPQWLYEHLLAERWVLGVSGTHGKTSTAAMLAWVLEFAGLAPGFLIGGVPQNFHRSARLGNAPFFVIEADEYDTAFFDKRSKFVHYHPRSLIINNLEYDHADIFPDLAAIQTQFHHLLRMLPGEGLLVHPANVTAIEQVLAKGCWTPAETIAVAKGSGGDWRYRPMTEDCGALEIFWRDALQGEIHWALSGHHNAANALAAIAAARHAGVPATQAVEALNSYAGVKRRLELLAEVAGIRVYDDFAHHPTAIKTTLEGLRRKQPQGRLIVVFEPRSNSMKLGTHQLDLASAFELADALFILVPEDLPWRIDTLPFSVPTHFFSEPAALHETLSRTLQPGDEVVFMSNGSFAGLHHQLVRTLKAQAA